MKIIDTDNHGGDYPNEKVIASGITNKKFADCMCKALNDRFCQDASSRRFYRVVEDNYKLQPGFVP